MRACNAGSLIPSRNALRTLKCEPETPYPLFRPETPYPLFRPETPLRATASQSAGRKGSPRATASQSAGRKGSPRATASQSAGSIGSASASQSSTRKGSPRATASQSAGSISSASKKSGGLLRSTQAERKATPLNLTAPYSEWKRAMRQCFALIRSERKRLC